MKSSFDYIEYAFTGFSESLIKQSMMYFRDKRHASRSFRLAVNTGDMTTSRLRFHKVK